MWVGGVAPSVTPFDTCPKCIQLPRHRKWVALWQWILRKYLYNASNEVFPSLQCNMYNDIPWQYQQLIYTEKWLFVYRHEHGIYTSLLLETSNKYS